MKDLIIIFVFLAVAVDAIRAEVSDLQSDDASGADTVVLSPRIKVSDLPLEQYHIKLEYFMPYLENVMIVQNPDLKKPKGALNNRTTQIVNPVRDLGINSSTSRYVVSFEKKSISMGGAKDRVFVSGLAKDNHINYFLVKPNFSYYHPDTREYLGTEIFIIGKAGVVQRGKLSLLKIESAKEPIKAGTLVLPSRSLDLPDDISVIASKQKLNGYILSTVPGLANAANNNVVVVSLGSRDGLEFGQLLKIKQSDLVARDPYDYKKKYTIPLSKPKGEVVIYDVFDKLSLGLVLTSYEEIKLLDRVSSS